MDSVAHPIPRPEPTESGEYDYVGDRYLLRLSGRMPVAGVRQYVDVLLAIAPR